MIENNNNIINLPDVDELNKREKERSGCLNRLRFLLGGINVLTKTVTNNLPLLSVLAFRWILLTIIIKNVKRI